MYRMQGPPTNLLTIGSRPSDATLDPAVLLTAFEGPGALLDKSGALLARSESASNLVELLVDENGNLTDLSVHLFQATKCGAAISKRCVAQPSSRDQVAVVFDLTVLPLVYNDTRDFVLLVLARDTSLERHLIEALVNSRTLYRDLAACSGDFIWEVDAEERFSYVSPGGAVGYLPQSLNGSSPASLALDEEEGPGLISFFGAREPTTDREIWVRSQDGVAACLIASARPVFDELGNWSGARGVARDVTSARRQERELVEQREDDALISAIARAVQQEMKPDEMLQAAADVLLEAFHAASVWIIPKGGAGRVAPPAAIRSVQGEGDDIADPDIDALNATSARLYGSQVVGHIWRKGAYLCLRTFHTDQENGLVILLDATGRAEAMLAHVSDHIANAIEQAKQLRDLDRVSKTDDLTGLLNRRAFMSMAAQRLDVESTSSKQSALMFIDMDNFKAVNDTYGHASGDDLLIALSDIMNRLIESCPNAHSFGARLGGDEFSLWLDQTGEAFAVLTAEKLVREFRLVAEGFEGRDIPGLSVGVALAGAGKPLTNILAQADQALYEVKRSGKGAWKLAAEDEAGVDAADPALAVEGVKV